jgi:hypothetical protein
MDNEVWNTIFDEFRFAAVCGTNAASLRQDGTAAGRGHAIGRRAVPHSDAEMPQTAAFRKCFAAAVFLYL